MDKKVIIFTTFWDAIGLINRATILHVENSDVYKIDLRSDKKDAGQPSNFFLHSIALSCPDFNKDESLKKYKNQITRLDFFRPTYSMISKYKSSRNWKDYTLKYKDLLKSRKDEIIEWSSSLKNGCVYFLCCWENTSGESKCHRDILYKAFKSSSSISNDVLLIYRHGDEDRKLKKHSRGNNSPEQISSSDYQDNFAPELTRYISEYIDGN